MAARIPLGQGRPGPFHRIPIGIGHGNEHDVGVFDAIHALDSATGGFRTEHHASASPPGHTVDSRMCQQMCGLIRNEASHGNRPGVRHHHRGRRSRPTRRSTLMLGGTATQGGADCTLGPRWTCPSRSSGTRSTGTNTVGAVAVTPACPHVDQDADAISSRAPGRPRRWPSSAGVCRSPSAYPRRTAWRMPR